MPKLEEISVKAHVTKTKEVESDTEKPEDQPDEELIDSETDTGTESFGKLWKKFKIWYTEDKLKTLEKIQVSMQFIRNEGTDAQIKKICETVKVSSPTKKELLFINSTCLHILDIYAKEFIRIQKTGSFLNAFSHPVSKSINIPECLQYIQLCKSIGIHITFDITLDDLISISQKEYDRRYVNIPNKVLSKLDISNLQDLEKLVNMINTIDQYLKRWYTYTNKHMVQTNQFPIGPKGLTLTKSEFELARINLYRIAVIRNCCSPAFDILDTLVTHVDNILRKIRSSL